MFFAEFIIKIIACVGLHVVLANLRYSPYNFLLVTLLCHHLLPPSLQKKRKEPAKPSAKKAKATGMSKKEKGLVTPNSLAMCTRSKTPKSPTMGTRSKRKILD